MVTTNLEAKRWLQEAEGHHERVWSPVCVFSFFTTLDITNKYTGPLNLHSVLLESHHPRCRHHNVQASPSVTSNENVSLPNPSEVTELGWKLPTPVTLLHREATSMLAKAWTLLRDRSAPVVWKHSGRWPQSRERRDPDRSPFQKFFCICITIVISASSSINLLSRAGDSVGTVKLHIFSVEFQAEHLLQERQ